jgi:hypothetical protein
VRARIGILAGVLAAVALSGASAWAVLDSSNGSSASRQTSTSNAGSRFSDGEPGVRGCRERIEGRFLEPNPKTDTTIGPVTFLGAPASYRLTHHAATPSCSPFPALVYQP